VSLRFGTDGVRGVANTELTPSYVLDLGRAAARVLARPGGERTTILVGRDTRRSGPLLEAALAAGIAAEGVDVDLLGVLPTPAVAHASAAEALPAAVITASHNPFADNGVKLFAGGGRKLPDDVETRIEQELHSLGPPAAAGDEVGRVTHRAGAGERYVEHLCRMFPSGDLAGVKVVVDGANGAMSAVAPIALSRLGAIVHPIHVDPDGSNINAECGATYPAAVAEAVVHHGADVGLAFDGDGDRLIAVDHLGQVVDGDRLMALLAADLKLSGRLARNTVVVTVMSNLGFRHAMAALDVDIVETAVGDRYVLEALESGGYSLGGEQSGHVILRDLATTGDGLLAGIELLHLVHRAGRPLAELASAAMEIYPQVLVNVRVANRPANVTELLADDIAAAEASLAGEGRVLLRPSGTEPLVRVMVEAATEELAGRTARSLAAAVQLRLSEN
jgi:phosphoglucosamine mutase